MIEREGSRYWQPIQWCIFIITLAVLTEQLTKCQHCAKYFTLRITLRARCYNLYLTVEQILCIAKWIICMKTPSQELVELAFDSNSIWFEYLCSKVCCSSLTGCYNRNGIPLNRERKERTFFLQGRRWEWTQCMISDWTAPFPPKKPSMFLLTKWGSLPTHSRLCSNTPLPHPRALPHFHHTSDGEWS